MAYPPVLPPERNLLARHAPRRGKARRAGTRTRRGEAEGGILPEQKEILMANPKTYRAAAIGRTGGGGYGHGLHLAYKGLENVEFVAVADPDEAGRAKAAAETGAPR